MDNKTEKLFKVLAEAEVWDRILFKYPQVIKKLVELIDFNKPTVELPLIDCLELISLLDKSLENEKELFEVKEQVKLVSSGLKQAYGTYNNDTTQRQDKRLSNVAKILGMTDGKPGRKSNRIQMYFEFLKLTSGGFDFKTYKKNEPVSRKEALKILKEKYCLQSVESVEKTLQRAKKALQK